MGKAQLKKLARGIVLAQGNRYIKELLRKHKIRIGTTKADFLENLVSAIDEGRLTQEHFDAWLSEVEGWGNQHAYLFWMPKSLRATTKMAELKRKARRKKLYNASPSLAFPEQRELTGVYCDDASFQLVWHEGFETWIRQKDRDYQAEEEPDLYEYRAYREQPKRSVMRFEWPLGKEVAAIFLQIPWGEEEHADALDQIWTELRRFGMKPPFKRVSLDERIRGLDEMDAPDDDLMVQSTRLSKQGAYVDFVSTVPDRDYKEVEAIAHVHQAVDHDDFDGDRGVFVFKSVDNKLTRDVKLQMYGERDRIRFWAQCAKSDVWTVIGRITDA